MVLKWVPEHTDVKVNEWADDLAKQGYSTQPWHLLPFMGLSQKCQDLNNWALETTWSWNEGRQKIWSPDKWHDPQTSDLIRVLMGHYKLQMPTQREGKYHFRMKGKWLQLPTSRLPTPHHLWLSFLFHTKIQYNLIGYDNCLPLKCLCEYFKILPSANYECERNLLMSN